LILTAQIGFCETSRHATGIGDDIGAHSCCGGACGCCCLYVGFAPAIDASAALSAEQIVMARIGQVPDALTFAIDHPPRLNSTGYFITREFRRTSDFCSTSVSISVRGISMRGHGVCARSV
jgi:hypothetical protein